jgi:hypothetical protein
MGEVRELGVLYGAPGQRRSESAAVLILPVIRKSAAQQPAAPAQALGSDGIAKGRARPPRRTRKVPKKGPPSRRFDDDEDEAFIGSPLDDEPGE